eukprot:scaffold73604_cov48-Phaeocystis_antarctica.AAC.2
MHKMFDVRSSPWPAPNLQSSPPPHAACAAVARRLPPPGPHLSPHRMPSFDSRQDAQAFNQPLSFDTSSATDMQSMFSVRSSPCPAPNLCSQAPPCALLAPRSPAAFRLLPPAPRPTRRAPSFRLSAEREGVQPAAEFRHLQRHKHVRHVLGALLPVPCSQSMQSSPPVDAACRCSRPPPPASRPVCLAPHRMPFFRLSAGQRGGVQPAAELRHL